MNNVLSLEEVFSQRLFSVPDYQRGYSWESRQRTELLEDLELLGQGKEHYTGTIVLHVRNGTDRPTDEQGTSYMRCDLVDGQQRLTSIVLLLDVIADHTKELPQFAKLTEGIRRRFHTVMGLDGQPLCILELNRDCQDFWRDCILAETPSPRGPSIQSHRRLFDAKQQFQQYLTLKKKAQKQNWEQWLLALYKKCTQQLRFTLYEVSSAADVGVIFEVLNNRGKQLSELEKVKNYLLYLASKMDEGAEKLADRVNTTWAKIFERLMSAGLTRSDDENQLLRVHWLAVYDHDRRHWEQSQSIKKAFSLSGHVGKHKVLLSKAMEYLKTLDDTCVAYCEASGPDLPSAFSAWEKDPEREQIRLVSRKLLRMRTLATFLPLLVAVRLRYPSQPWAYLEAVQFCELFAFRVYRFSERRSNTGQSTIFWHAHNLFEGKADIQETLTKLYGALRYYSPDSDFESELKRTDDWYRWGGLRYFLYEYEEHLAGKAAVKLSWEEVEARDLDKTIEHVLPQSPTDKYWLKRFSADDLRIWTHDIANLCLTSHNSYYGNKSFPKKKGAAGQKSPCYCVSNLFQERALAEFSDWSPAELKKRRRRMESWALKRWAVRSVAPAEPMPEYDEDG